MYKKMKKLETDHLSEKYTQVFHEEEFNFNAPHIFEVRDLEGDLLAGVNFQEGPIKEAGVNGVMNEDLIAMVIARLTAFQNSEFACSENAAAITKLNEALDELRKRTVAREKRGVEGTHTI